MHCINCGKTIEENHKFCQHCGNGATNVPDPKKSARTKNWIIGVGIAAAIIAFYVVRSFATYTPSSGDSSADDFKTSYRSSFIQSCENAGGGGDSSGTYCACVADYMINHYNDVQLTNITAKYKISSKPPQELIEAAGNCVSK